MSTSIIDYYGWGYDTNTGIINSDSSSSDYDFVQDEKIDANARNIRRNDSVDVAQQGQIDENTSRLNENDITDARQESEIKEMQGEVTDYSVNNTTFVIQKRKESAG